MKGAGASFEKRAYEFFHKHPALGNNYYQIAAVDFDGKKDYSEVERVNFATTPGIITLVPNPNNGSVVVYSNSINTNTPFKVLDGQGREVKVTVLQQNRGVIKLEHDLPFGMYLIYFPSTNEYVKMVVQ